MNRPPEQARAGVLPHEFGVFVRSEAQLDRAKAAKQDVSGLRASSHGAAE